MIHVWLSSQRLKSNFADRRRLRNEENTVRADGLESDGLGSDGLGPDGLGLDGLRADGLGPGGMGPTVVGSNPTTYPVV